MNPTESQPSDKPQWPEGVDPHIKWLAMDSNGLWWQYWAYEPQPDNCGWWQKGHMFGYCKPLDNSPDWKGDWRDSLIQRPQNPEPKQAREMWLTGPDLQFAYGSPEMAHLKTGITPVHFREVLPGRMTFQRAWDAGDFVDIVDNLRGNESVSDIFRGLHAAWNASAANGEQPYYDSKLVKDLQQLTRERDDARKALSESVQIRSELAEKLTRCEAQRDEARRELEVCVSAAKTLADDVSLDIEKVQDERDKLRAELEKLKNPVSVYLSIQTGAISKPSDEQLYSLIESPSELAHETKLRAELKKSYNDYCVLDEECDRVKAELSTLKSHKGGSTIESMGGVEATTQERRSGLDTPGANEKDAQVIVKDQQTATTESASGTSAPPHASSGQPEGKEGDATCRNSMEIESMKTTYPDTSSPSPKVQPSGEGVPTREELGKIAFTAMGRKHPEDWPKIGEADRAWYCDSAEAVRDRLSARATREPKGDDLGAAAIQMAADMQKQRDTLQQRLEEVTEHDKGCLKILEYLGREQNKAYCQAITAEKKLSDAQSEVARWKHNAEAINDNLEKSQAEVKRLDELMVGWRTQSDKWKDNFRTAQSTVERLEEWKTKANQEHNEMHDELEKRIVERNTSQATVERLKVELNNLKFCLETGGMVSHMVPIIERALASITAPTASVSKPRNPAGLTEWGQSDGWRLLDEDEICARKSYMKQIEMWLAWNGTGWDACCMGDSKSYTYRTKLSREDLAAISKGEKP